MILAEKDRRHVTMDKADVLIVRPMSWIFRALCLFLMIGVQTPPVLASIPQIERDALIALYHDTCGHMWENNENWLNDWGNDLNDPGTECTWYGVTCDAGNTTVTSLLLSDNGLCWKLPAEIGNLTGLQSLDLSWNNMDEKIPPEIGNLTSLQSLSLFGNCFRGSIPSGIWSLTSLQSLDLGWNYLEGEIPPVIGSLTNLELLNLSANWLTGEIPPEIGDLTNLHTLGLSLNQLSGEIPPEIAKLTGLPALDLSGNQLSGEIPAEIGSLTGLQSLNLFWNQLSGEIPPEIARLTSLQVLDLSWNQLCGTIPPEIGSLTSLQVLDLSENRLRGPIPSEIGGLASLTRLYLYSNLLDGEIPTEIWSLTGLKTLYLSGNRLSGAIPPEVESLTSLQYLFIASNQLRGAAPSEIESLTGLLSSSVDLRWNALYSDDPALTAFLSSRQVGGDWQSTQTVAPQGVTVTSVGDHTVWLAWTPVTYEDSGGYQVSSEEVPGGSMVAGGLTESKTVTTLPVTSLLPGQPYDLMVSTFTDPHPDNQSTVVSEPGMPVMATTSNLGCASPDISIGLSCPTILSVVSSHDSYEWSTGETSSSIMVQPESETWYWVKTTGPASCEEAGGVNIAPCLFGDDFESGDTSAWSEVSP
jgi:Leucine-rich repeat (LRR) protein